MASGNDPRRFRPGLRPRGHDAVAHGSVAAYVASLGEAEADIVDEVFGPSPHRGADGTLAEEDVVDAKETAEELRQSMLEAERRLRERLEAQEAVDE